MLERQKERSMDVGGESYAVGWTIFTDAHGFLGECDCLSMQQARRHKKASITLPNYHKYAPHTM